MFPIYEVIFFIFSILLIISALMVVVAQNPVHSVLFLVLAFFASAVLWMLLQAEFLSLVLIFVYVGAVMTLFLFVVMMLNIHLSSKYAHLMRYLPLGIIILLLFMAAVILAIRPEAFHLAGSAKLLRVSDDYSNVKTLGELLFTKHLYAFEIAGLILLVAIISAIILGFYRSKSNQKRQFIQNQLQANKQNRLTVIKMDSEEMQ